MSIKDIKNQITKELTGRYSKSIRLPISNINPGPQPILFVKKKSV